MLRFVSNSPDDTRDFAKKIASKLSGGDVIAFTGTLGAGKTEFTKGIAAAFGYPGTVYSPTFAIINEYVSPESKFPIYHFDMYRISGFDSLYSTGFFDFLDSGAVLVVEWSENISEYPPENTIFIDITRDFDNIDSAPDKRIITLKGDGRFDDIGY
ncbi:MAG: tRNA (adenosine(37)-N6)-threonylcarbamoyltransferase complex ATPase subunit type 1 TsaE [Oscillospiraceae bacterium]|nr:tRNA (adenosine(37)-N6)-threonylcarbamoyltransferase complex ATPase subunit type 1 TsaE [Oscillospiraceae bacterium]